MLIGFSAILGYPRSANLVTKRCIFRNFGLNALQVKFIEHIVFFDCFRLGINIAINIGVVTTHCYA